MRAALAARGARAGWACVALLFAARAPAVTGTDPACGTVALVAGPGRDHLVLPHGFVRAGSDSVWTRRGALRRDADYVLDRLRGDLRLLVPMAAGETLWVASCWLIEPPPLEVSRQVYRPLPPPSAAPAPPKPADSLAARTRPSTQRDLASAPGGSALSVTGNKTIAVEFGSTQDAALRQSLDLAVGGTLAPGVELTGVLSDRNTPLSAAGSTQDLQALDRVLLELRAPHGAAALGDVALELRRGEFARLERQVQGARASWSQGGFEGTVAAASAQGEYHSVQLSGADGLQGPYLLTDRDGGTGVSVVAGSEIVTLDGVRMARGESADYAMDYERARLTFTNRRPITSASRITVEYQYALNRYRRNLAAFSGEWRGGRSRLFSSMVSEGDDRGRPLDATLGTQDLAALAAAGDSAARAIGEGIVAGGGDYDTVRAGHDSLIVAYAGPDSGEFAVRFARVGAGLGDYLDSALVESRTVYRWVGPGMGTHVLGRALPLPESHQVVTLGGASAWGPVTLEAEGAISRRDANTASGRGDDDNAGTATRLALGTQGRAGPLPGSAGLQFTARAVERRFSPFSRLERPFAEQDWGLPAGADLEHQRRADASAFWRPAEGSELRATLGRLGTPDGFSGTRRLLEWTSVGTWRSRGQWLDSDGQTSGSLRGGRRHVQGELARTGRWLAPTARFELDERRVPSAAGTARDRVQDVIGEIASGSGLRWRALLGVGGRLDRADGAGGSSARRATTLRAAAESPAGGSFGGSFTGQRRLSRDVGSGARTTSDLGGVRLRAERRPWGLSGQLDVELTSEADNRRTRVLTYVGPGQGGYDAFGNFVGTGDYALALVVSPELDRYARIVTSARLAWQFGASEALRGSRVVFTLEDEARRPGGPRAADVFLSTGLALVDPALSRGRVVQRLEGDLAPGSRVAAVLLRAERRVSADRSTSQFAQTNDQRSGSVRWRLRPGASVTVESQAQVQWSSAVQEAAGAGRYERTLIEQGATSQLTWQARPTLRVAGALELDMARPRGVTRATRTVRMGPDVGADVGKRGRLELALRRAFVSGPAAVSLLPSADPAGFARWDGSARFDLRVHETTTFGVSALVRERPEFPAVVNGRAEVRAFF